MQEQIIPLAVIPMRPEPAEIKAKKVVSKRVLALSFLLMLIIAVTVVLYQKDAAQSLKTTANNVASSIKQTFTQAPQILTAIKGFILGKELHDETETENTIPDWLDAEALSQINQTEIEPDPSKLNLAEITAQPQTELLIQEQESPSLELIVSPLPQIKKPTLEDLSLQFSQISARAEIVIVQSKELLSQHQPASAAPEALLAGQPAPQLNDLAQQLSQISQQTEQLIAQAQAYIIQIQTETETETQTQTIAPAAQLNQ